MCRCLFNMAHLQTGREKKNQCNKQRHAQEARPIEQLQRKLQTLLGSAVIQRIKMLRLTGVKFDMLDKHLTTHPIMKKYQSALLSVTFFSVFIQTFCQLMKLFVCIKPLLKRPNISFPMSQSDHQNKRQGKIFCRGFCALWTEPSICVSSPPSVFQTKCATPVAPKPQSRFPCVLYPG